MRSMAKEFEKYKKKGAYHWRMISRNLRDHSPFTVARYRICLEMLGQLKNRIIVDFGCGDGALAGMIAKAGGQVIGIEPNEIGLDLARKMFTKFNLEGRFYSKSSELEDACCDAAVCADVIEHVDSPDEIYKEIFRILKPQGIAIISTPIRLSEEPWDKEHVREYFPSEFKALCKRHGEIIEMRQAIPLAAQDLFYYRRGLLGRLLNLTHRVRSAWFDRNYLLTWNGLNRYHVLQVAKLLNNVK
jgi:2-polyprenyl-3-methyl-5-hydroxy-6-metoxy-1,4-benzoquinol methylase